MRLTNLGLSRGREADITLLEDIETRYGAESAPYSVGSGAPLQVKAAGTLC